MKINKEKGVSLVAVIIAIVILGLMVGIILGILIKNGTINLGKTNSNMSSVNKVELRTEKIQEVIPELFTGLENIQ